MNKEPDISEDLKITTVLTQLCHVKDLLLLIDIAKARIEKEDLDPLKRRDH